MSDYQPIPCATYSEYEVAILHHTRLRIEWVDETGEPHIETLLPRDLQTRDHKEYLLATDQNSAEYTIRLDGIRSASAVDSR